MFDPCLNRARSLINKNKAEVSISKMNSENFFYCLQIRKKQEVMQMMDDRTFCKHINVVNRTAT